MGGQGDHRPADGGGDFMLPQGQSVITRFDVRELRRHHNQTVRRFRQERKRRRQLEVECEQLRGVIVELTVNWYATGDRLPGMLGGGDTRPLFGFLSRPVDDVDRGEDNDDRG